MLTQINNLHSEILALQYFSAVLTLFSPSHTSFCCWGYLSCRYNANTTGLNFIDIVATLKCSNLIPSETEGFQP